MVRTVVRAEKEVVDAEVKTIGGWHLDKLLARYYSRREKRKIFYIKDELDQDQDSQKNEEMISSP